MLLYHSFSTNAIGQWENFELPWTALFQKILHLVVWICYLCYNILYIYSRQDGKLSLLACWGKRRSDSCQNQRFISPRCTPRHQKTCCKNWSAELRQLISIRNMPLLKSTLGSLGTFLICAPIMPGLWQMWLKNWAGTHF